VSIVDNLERIRQWAEETICQKVQLKLPDDDRVDASYQHTLVHPAAFVLYVPSKDRMPPDILAPIPSLCIQLIEGEEQVLARKGLMRVRFCFAAWNPGNHGKDIFQPLGDGTYKQWDTDEAKEYFRRYCDGWKDAWNFVDTALREIGNADNISGLRVMKEEGIKYGPVADQDAIPDFYPYWFAWVSFALECGVIRCSNEYQEFL